MEVAGVVEARNVIGDGELHHAVMLLFQVEGEAAQAQQIGDASLQLVLIQGPEDEIIDELAKVPGGEGAFPAGGEQEEGKEDGFLALAALSNLGAVCLHDRTIEDGQ